MQRIEIPSSLGGFITYEVEVHDHGALVEVVYTNVGPYPNPKGFSYNRKVGVFSAGVSRLDEQILEKISPPIEPPAREIMDLVRTYFNCCENYRGAIEAGHVRFLIQDVKRARQAVLEQTGVDLFREIPFPRIQAELEEHEGDHHVRP
ncbi:MAG: hypothetical protein K1Y36_29625 [Blastocatellia bacterium]|nr:hypothetical protein [Blastocatellia bacterium]